MILLTGTSGFIGRFFLQFDIEVRYVVRDPNVCKTADQFLIDTLDGGTNWDGAFGGVDSIIHLAGLAHSRSFTAEDYQSVNVDGSLHLASEAAKSGVRRFIFVSSIGVNGTSTIDTPFSNVSDFQPHNAYVQSKLDAEIGLKKIAMKTGMELVIVRPTLVYGPNAPGNFGALTRLVGKVPVLPFGLTQNKRDFISVHNLVDLLITCANDARAAGHIFLASDRQTISVKDFTNAIAKGLNKRVIQLPIPVWLLRLTGKLLGKSVMVEQLVGNLEVDSSNTQEVLGWTPPYTMQQAMYSLVRHNR